MRSLLTTLAQHASTALFLSASMLSSSLLSTPAMADGLVNEPPPGFRQIFNARISLDGTAVRISTLASLPARVRTRRPLGIKTWPSIGKWKGANCTTTVKESTQRPTKSLVTSSSCFSTRRLLWPIVNLPERKSASSDLGLHGKGKVLARRRQRKRWTLEQ